MDNTRRHFAAYKHDRHDRFKAAESIFKQEKVLNCPRFRALKIVLGKIFTPGPMTMGCTVTARLAVAAIRRH